MALNKKQWLNYDLKKSRALGTALFPKVVCDVSESMFSNYYSNHLSSWFNSNRIITGTRLRMS